MSFRGGAPTVSQKNFAHITQAATPRSTFNLSHGRKMTIDAGFLYPALVDEIYPGDTFQVNISGSARLATPITPYMDNMYMETHWFFCPNRLIWTNWERFMGAQDDPDSSIDFLIPQVVSPAVTGFANSTLYDYFGFPTQVPGLSQSAFPGRVYNLTYNQWYRDENLQDSLVVDTDDGPDTYTDYVLKRRGKRKDYFTSALPFTQKGAAVDIPLGTTAPIITNGVVPKVIVGANPEQNWTQQGSPGVMSNNVGANTGNVTFGSLTGLVADLTDASASTINQLRQAFAVQQLLELDARGGTRYVELLKAHFNVVSPDFRLQRVEFLGGGSSPVIVQPIPQTSETGSTPQGTLAAYATVGFNSGHSFSKSFVEHGVLMCLVSVRADLNYQQGLNRKWSRRTRYDYYFPVFANLGEQPILNKEIYAQGTADAVADAAVFGYQEPWAELRYFPNEICGQFRSNFAQTLDIWHLAQYFTALPTLNGTFIEENPPVDRVKALGDDYPDFLVDLAFQMKVTRELPLYGTPGLRKL